MSFLKQALAFCLGLYALLFVTLFFEPLAAWAQNDIPFNTTAIKALQAKKWTGTYRFVVTGDNRDGDQILVKIFQDAQRFKPDFMVHTGDFVSLGRYRDYLHFIPYLQTAPFPVIAALGNHDAVYEGRKWYQQFMSRQTYFSFTLGPDRFIILDNANGEISPGQLKWLENQLKSKARYRFVAMHKPPQNIIWIHSFGGPSAEKMMQLLEKYKANYAFFGHTHIYDKMINNGVTYIISGGAGAPLYRMPLYISPEGGAFYHYMLMEVSPKGIKENIIRLK